MQVGLSAIYFDWCVFPVADIGGKRSLFIVHLMRSIKKVGRLASADVVIELLKTKCMPILLYGLDACPVSPRQLRSLNYVIVSCGRKFLM